MELREGRGNEYQDGSRPTEGDEVNVVWVVDSKQLPFFQVGGWGDGPSWAELSGGGRGVLQAVTLTIACDLQARW
jgi:hypothetical protein